jgi:hypothetical protein
MASFEKPENRPNNSAHSLPDPIGPDRSPDAVEPDSSSSGADAYDIDESEATAPAAIERRLQRNIVISIAIFIVFAAFFGSARFTAGVCLGGALAYLNYRWLHGSLKAIFAEVKADEPPLGAYQATAKFILRWLVIFAALAVAGWLGGMQVVIGAVVGLFAFAGAAMLEAGAQFWWSLGGDKRRK